MIVTLESDGLCTMEKPLTSFPVKEEKKGLKYVVTIPDIYWLVLHVFLHVCMYVYM